MMRLLFWTAGLALCAAVWQPAGQAGQTGTARESDRGMIAVLRRDGILIPFAAFKGDDWSAPWPVDVRNRDLPISLDDVPDRWWGGRPLEGWHVRLTDGKVRDITLQQPVTYRLFCDTRIGLRTDYRSTEPLLPAPVGPYPKDGLAATGGIGIAPIEVVDPNAAAAKALVTALTKAFDDAEDKTANELHGSANWKHPFKKNDRHKLPVRIEAWYRAPLLEEGLTVSYIEAVRSYPPRPEDEGCGLETLFSGWVFQNAAEPKSSPQLSARITYCDRNRAMYMLPLGRVRLKSRQFWVFQYSGWDQEWYEVAGISPQKVRFEVEYYAGSRRSCLGPGRE